MVMAGQWSSWKDLCDQFVKQWEGWSGTQQACVAAALVSSIEPHAAFFLHNLLHHKLADISAIWNKEIQLANSPAFVKGLQSEPRDVAVSQLLHHLPLLRSGSQEAARGYVHLIPRLFGTLMEEEVPQHSFHHQSPQPQQQPWNELEQLLTYALIHPALTLEEKRTLAQLVHKLDDKSGQDMALSLLESELDVLQLQQTAGAGHWNNPWNRGGSVSMATHNRVRRSNSLTPQSYTADAWNTCQDDCNRGKPRSHSLSSPLDRNVAASGASDTSQPGGEDAKRVASFSIPESGMKDVPSWLKSLRLHKYANLFAQLTYEEMLSLTEEQLEAQGVTKGARHKIALSIQRLRDRPALLSQLEKDINETGNIQTALTELKTMLASPIKPFKGPNAYDDSAYETTSVSPSPSCGRDDTSGCSSLDGSTDSLAPRFSCSPKEDCGKLGSLISPAANDMPTVIVSAAPDSDSGGEGSETSGEDGDSYKSLVNFTDPSNEDLAGMITRILGKICTQLLVTASPSEENINQFVNLLERCMNHEAFGYQHRRRLTSWKDQIQQIWHYVPSTPAAKNKPQDSRHSRRWSNVAHYPGFYSDTNAVNYGAPGNSYTLFPPRPNRGGHVNHRNVGNAHNALNTHNLYGQHNHLMPQGAGLSTIAPPKSRPLAPTLSFPLSSSLSPSSAAAHCHAPLQHRNSFCVSALSHPSPSATGSAMFSSTLDPFSFSETQRPPLVDSFNEWLGSRYGNQRARSAPTAPNSNFYSFSNDKERDSGLDIDLNHRLESLCLSMTEHALEGANDF